MAERPLQGAPLVIALNKAMQGEASIWFSQITFAGMTWDDFKSLFTARYDCRETDAGFLINMNNNRPKEEETLASYAATMYTSLMSRWKDATTEQIAVSHILAHLALFEPRVQRLSFTTAIPSREKLQQELLGLSFKRKFNDRDAPDAKRFKSLTTVPAAKCFTCDKTGHKASQCRSKPSSSTVTDARPQQPPAKLGVICFNCRGTGHYAKNCSKPKETGTSGEATAASEKRIEVCNVTTPYGTLRHAGEAFSFYYDSGAECSLMKESVSNKFHGKWLQNCVIMTGIGLAKVVRWGPLSVKGFRFKENLKVCT
jgi:hypothetical protein